MGLGVQMRKRRNCWFLATKIPSKLVMRTGVSNGAGVGFGVGVYRGPAHEVGYGRESYITKYTSIRRQLEIRTGVSNGAGVGFGFGFGVYLDLGVGSIWIWVWGLMEFGVGVYLHTKLGMGAAGGQLRPVAEKALTWSCCVLSPLCKTPTGYETPAGYESPLCTTPTHGQLRLAVPRRARI